MLDYNISMVEKFCMEKKLIYLLQVVYAQNPLIVVVNTIASTVDHHSLEYGPSNKNLFQTMGVFHTMGGFISQSLFLDKKYMGEN